ncbi:hypothetical protein HYH02_000595 [Chlamydomonas schloesseri]|uniref:Uncharacterized protein n=1 Tax=Chlamydomonas schloesseri TaxID=2026947 RepID=A0A836BDK9_9CHLO|nr:hypothetical protein HYH02_000595 [Chlamydomonas schloesseri]|eukprot:KAG2454760.1 hypothetical protein HYH02_000595 [Chlamydomonas schloesseri]
MARIPLERYLDRPRRSDEAGCSPPTASGTVAPSAAAGTAAHHAAVKRIHMLGLLVVTGSLPRFSPDSAATLLRDACMVESPQAVAMVLRCAASPLCPAQAQPAILAAAERGAVACVRELLSLTCVDPTADNSLALRLASRAGSAACVEALLAAGAALERQHVAGFSPLDGLEGGVHSCLAEVGHSAEALAQAAAAAAAAGHAHVVGLLLRSTRYPAALASLAAVFVARGSSCSASEGVRGAAAGSGGGAAAVAAATGSRVGDVLSFSAPAAATCGVTDDEALPAMRMLLAAGAEPSAFNGAMLVAACGRSPALVHRSHGESSGKRLQDTRLNHRRNSCSNSVAASAPSSDCSALRRHLGAADLVRELLAAGADPRAEDSLPLVTACRVGADVEVVQALLAAGADAGAQDGAALRYACKHGAAEAVVALLAAAPGCHGLFGLATALAEAVAAGHRGVADALLGGCRAHGVEAHLVKDLALIQVAQAGCLDAVRLLLLMGAAAASCSSKALTAAAEAGHEAVVEALLAAGADATARDSAPLIGAARCGRTAVVRRLLAAGADPCARDSWALWAASEAGHMDTVAVLMAAGADPAVPMDEEAAGFDVASLINEMECDG